MTKERLIFKGVSEIVGTEDLGLLILTDEAKERQITIVCDKAMAVQLELRIKKIPITRIMLPEVLCRMLKNNGGLDYELLIDNIIDGQYRTILYDKETMDPLLIRASDAVLLSIVANIPLYIEAGLMRRQSVMYNENAKGVSLPVNTISDEMLQVALDKAIADENYELASHLRDEKKRRTKKDDNHDN
ncbi:MAG TPA: bifunctional nuclease family protein [Candidatus Prevotella stercoripullorum]|nr:bifunctional nuclease family protein [Candidatus Prevotella stercoripullorum]